MYPKPVTENIYLKILKMTDFEDEEFPDWIGCKPGGRQTVASVAMSMGRHFKRAYKMEYEELLSLSRKLAPLIDVAIRKSGINEDPPSPNTRIGPSLRLAVTIRVVNGGDPLDMVLTYGISEPSVKRSIKFVMEAINDEEEWEAIYPESQEERKAIAQKFEKVRFVGVS